MRVVSAMRQVVQLENSLDDWDFVRGRLEATKRYPIVNYQASAQHIAASVHGASLNKKKQFDSYLDINLE